MKISIITVCLNAKDTIEETFKSIFNQTYEDVELIVVDGLSTDGTIDVIKKYKSKIAYFISESDKGIYDAMNKGVSLATGDFIFFLNANDTLYDNQTLEKVKNKLIENPTVKFLFGDIEVIYRNEQEPQIKTYTNIKNDFSLMFDNLCHQSIFYHKSLFEKYDLYSMQYKIYSDWDFNIRCLVKNKVEALYLPIVISKFDFTGISSDPNSQSIWEPERKMILKKYYPIFRLTVFVNNYLKKKYSFYNKLKQTSVFTAFINLFCSQKKYQLNIQEN